MIKELEVYKDADYDSIFFLPDENVKEAIRIESMTYANRGERFITPDGSPIWHVLVMDVNTIGQNKLTNEDIVDAVLLDHLEYLSSLITTNFYGVLSRKTTTSRIIIENVLAMFNAG